jgi:di/tricarboxylate transporter
MTFEAWYTVGTIVLVIAALMTNRVSVDVAMFGGLTLLLIGNLVFGGILPLESGIRGFAHPALIMIGALFVIAAGLQETGGMEIIARRLLGRPRSVTGAQFRLMTPVALMSACMNNTPIVAMYLPIVNDWARKIRVSPSKLYMPLSFAAILGGKITLIGTASNIVVMGLYVQYLRDPSQSAWLADLVSSPSAQKQFWGVAALGIPTSIAGLAVIMVFGRWLLPERRSVRENVIDSRQYVVEMVVQPDSPIVGQSIEQAGLRHLPGLYLSKLERGGKVIPAVSPMERIEAGDRLGFAGILESVVDLRKIRGLLPDTDQVEKVAVNRGLRALVEAVVAHNSPLVGRTVRESRFRTKYNAAIIAVHRNGEQINAKVGDIVLRPGDTLLLETHSGFVSAFRNSDDFYLVSEVEGARPIRHERAGLALAILGLLIAMLTLTPVPPMISALICAGLMVGTRCLTGTIARSSINWQVLIVIGAALGMGAALRETKAAEQIAHEILSLCAGFGPRGMLAVLFVLTVIFAQLITSYGTAVLMFPITMVTAQDLGLSPEPFVFSLMIAAGSTYLSPISYQTNLMVYNLGGYRFADYARLGLPITIVLTIICALLAPIVFPFHPGS